ncbi:flagellar biosynthesis anti-sigma factor FlgM [Bacillus sp. HMF5848]|uniref:flagellar biosynthesis anti-sigma factor FlgM n=1 Tax=Bacillus sp. HMF5848 TaxID=2495421 RepID=UPI000F7B26AB|nr:flagellar biosynthesis anti-sigma factor FlgM [Bacillus sp. HMF5848]RSK28626.1 flagellar biosynthesis anti-sigma factor FlgM [Bacillus sp. HMF5848]
MKINNIGPSGVNPYRKNDIKFKEATKTTQTDKVEISKEAIAKASMQQSPIVADRQQKVAELRDQVQNGAYQPNADATAKGLLDFFSKK